MGKITISNREIEFEGEVITFDELKYIVLKEFDQSPFKKVTFFEDPEKHNKVNKKGTDLVDLKTDLYVEFSTDPLFYKNAKPKDLITEYNKVYLNDDEDPNQQIYFEIPEEYFGTPFSQIPIQSILSNIVFATKNNDKEDVVSHAYEFDVDQFNKEHRDVYSQINKDFKQKKNEDSIEVKFTFVNNEGELASGSIECDCIMSGKEIKEKVLPGIRNINKDVESLQNVFIKANVNLFKVEDEINYYMAQDIDERMVIVELLCTLPENNNDIIKVEIEESEQVSYISNKVKNELKQKKQKMQEEQSKQIESVEQTVTKARSFTKERTSVASEDFVSKSTQPVQKVMKTHEKIVFQRCSFYNEVINEVKNVVGNELNNLELVCDIAQINVQYESKNDNIEKSDIETKAIGYCFPEFNLTRYQIFTAIQYLCKIQGIECPIKKEEFEKLNIEEQGQISIMTYINTIESKYN